MSRNTNPYRVFVSSTFEDLREHRRHVIGALRLAGMDVEAMEEFSASSKSPSEFCSERMKRCNLCVLLVGFRRGDRPPQIPLELEKLFVVLEHSLPDRDQLARIARELTSDNPDDLPKGEDLQRVLDAAAGLTRYEAEGAFALSLTRRNAIRPEVIWGLKAQTLKKSNLLTLHRG